MLKVWLMALTIVSAVVIVGPVDAAPCEHERHQCMENDESSNWGDTIAISGFTVAITSGLDSVYVLGFDGQEWHLHQILDDPEGEQEGFGAGLDFSSDATIVVVGTPFDIESLPNPQGSVSVFVLKNGTWILQQKLVPPSTGNSWGGHVAISDDGDVIVIGTQYSAAPVPDEEGVHVYRRSAGVWIHETLLRPAGTTDNITGGVDISDDGSRIVLGSVYYPHDNTTVGIAYAFEYDGASWVEQNAISPSSLEPGDAFGYDVEIGGNDSVFIFAGGFQSPIGGMGSVYVFEADVNGDWVETDELVPEEGNSYKGISVDGVDQHLAIGENTFGDGAAVVVYDYDGTKWILGETIPIGTSDYVVSDVGIDRDLSLACGPDLKSHYYECMETLCDGDANDDRVVDPLDAGYILSRFGCLVTECTDLNCSMADQNGDGVVDPMDVGYVMARFGDCP